LLFSLRMILVSCLSASTELGFADQHSAHLLPAYWIKNKW
jgi:hypothetical protein